MIIANIAQKLESIKYPSVNTDGENFKYPCVNIDGDLKDQVFERTTRGNVLGNHLQPLCSLKIT